MNNVGNPADPGIEESAGDRINAVQQEVTELRRELRELRSQIATEVRTSRLRVVDKYGIAVVDVEPHDDGGRLTVGRDYGQVVIGAGSMSPASIDLLSGIVPCEMAVHLRADFDEHVSLVALSGHGDVLGEYHLRGDDHAGWRVEHIDDSSR